jgi:tRNA threonylcarbamoyladenosine biosynthesis protein TsaE
VEGWRIVRLDEIELARWGERIGETVDPPAVIGLTGPLGAGKSVLARAIGRGVGVDVEMPSPSYNLLLRYPTTTGTDVVHLDLYRIESPDELWELGWSQLGAEGEVVLVEWPERAESMLPKDHWMIELSVPDGQPKLRDVEVHRVGSPPELAGFPMSVAISGE